VINETAVVMPTTEFNELAKVDSNVGLPSNCAYTTEEFVPAANVILASMTTEPCERVIEILLEGTELFISVMRANWLFVTMPVDWSEVSAA
jgi:hypothetical protein